MLCFKMNFSNGFRLHSFCLRLLLCDFFRAVATDSVDEFDAPQKARHLVTICQFLSALGHSLQAKTDDQASFGLPPHVFLCLKQIVASVPSIGLAAGSGICSHQ